MITSDLTTNSSNPVERALDEFRKQVLEPYGMKFLQRQSVPNQSRISLPWNVWGK